MGLELYLYPPADLLEGWQSARSLNVGEFLRHGCTDGPGWGREYFIWGYIWANVSRL